MPSGLQGEIREARTANQVDDGVSEKELEQLRQQSQKSEGSSQQETDAPSKAAYKSAIRALGQLQTAGLVPEDHPANKSLKAEVDQAKAASEESVPLSKRIRAGQNQKETSKRPTSVCRKPNKTSLLPKKSLEQHRAKVENIEKALQERRNHLEHLHRQAAAEASHGAEATHLEIMFPDGITKHLPQDSKDSLKMAADLYEEERKAEAAAKEAAARSAKEGMEVDEFGGLDEHG